MMDDSPLKDIRIGKITTGWAKARGLTCKYKESLGSTNDWAKDEAFKEESFEENIIVYLADNQTKGRGRQKNTWSTPELGASLLSSWSFLIEEPPVPVTSPRAGLAVYRAAATTWPFLNWSLKAPNDLYLAEKKIGGLLLETLTQGDDIRLIVGFGFNVTAHPQSVAASTSLAQSFPPGVPLLGEDWIHFLDRLIFELSIVIERQQASLSESEQVSLTYVLNQRPDAPEKIISIGEDGTLKTSKRTISWMEL